MDKYLSIGKKFHCVSHQQIGGTDSSNSIGSSSSDSGSSGGSRRGSISFICFKFITDKSTSYPALYKEHDVIHKHNKSEMMKKFT